MMAIGQYGWKEMNLMIDNKDTINDTTESTTLKSVSIVEQETHISWMRDEEFAKIYTSDTTTMTKLDKLCQNDDSPYSLIADTGVGKSYICKDKSLISFRSKKRELSPEQRKLAGDRMRKYHQENEIRNRFYGF